MRGYLRTEGDRKRLRIVKPGYDANDPAVPFDAVLFDSDSDGMGSVLDAGIYTFTSSGNYVSTTGTWIKTWNHAFVPLCFFSFEVQAGGYPASGYSAGIDLALQGTNSIAQPVIRVSKTGIWVRGAFPIGVSGAAFRIKWVALRVAAT